MKVINHYGDEVLKVLEEKMTRLTQQLKQQFTEVGILEANIKANLKKLGYNG